MSEPLTINGLAIDEATSRVEDLGLIKSSHVIMVPWCQCCATRVDVEHVCSCEVPKKGNP